MILGTVAIEKPEIVRDLAIRHPNKIIVGIDAKEGKVVTRGWINQSNIKATDLAKTFLDTGIAAIITTDISTDGTLQGPNLEAMKQVASHSNHPVIASGGIGSIADLLSLQTLEPYGITGIIVGRALYEGTIDLQEAIKAFNIGPLADPPLPEDFYA